MFVRTMNLLRNFWIMKVYMTSLKFRNSAIPISPPSGRKMEFIPALPAKIASAESTNDAVVKTCAAGKRLQIRRKKISVVNQNGDDLRQ